MVHYFKLPGDFYFWGQDRLGSLIPLLGQIPNKLFGLTPILSESLTHYAILFLGFLAFSTFIRSNYYKIIFGVIDPLSAWSASTEMHFLELALQEFN